MPEYYIEGEITYKVGGWVEVAGPEEVDTQHLSLLVEQAEYEELTIIGGIIEGVYEEGEDLEDEDE